MPSLRVTVSLSSGRRYYDPSYRFALHLEQEDGLLQEHCLSNRSDVISLPLSLIRPPIDADWTQVCAFERPIFQIGVRHEGDCRQLRLETGCRFSTVLLPSLLVTVRRGTYPRLAL